MLCAYLYIRLSVIGKTGRVFGVVVFTVGRLAGRYSVPPTALQNYTFIHIYANVASLFLAIMPVVRKGKKLYLCSRMLNWRKIAFLGLALLAACPLVTRAGVYGKDAPPVIRAYTLSPVLAQSDSAVVDTGYIDLPMYDVPNRYSIANSWNGNLVSPIQSKIWFDRTEKIDFLFARAYEPYVTTPQDLRFYNTNTPFSTIAYKRSFTAYHEESDIDFSFTGNVTRRTNLGLALNYLNSPGQYMNQAGKRFEGHAFGSYNGDHYGCHGAVMISSLSNFENGGLSNPEDLGGNINSYDLTTRMAGGGGMAGLRYISGYWNHHYSICVERDRKQTIRPPRGTNLPPRDTVITEYIPVTTFMHTFEVNQAVKRYVEQQNQTAFFDTAYFHSGYTGDTANVLSIRNTLAVTFEEEFNKWLHFGATVYAVNEFQRHSYVVPDYLPWADTAFNLPATRFSTANQLALHTDSLTGFRWTNNTWVGGALYKNRGKWVRYGFQGDVCVVGYKIGEFKVDGHVNGDFPIGKYHLLMKANAYIKNQTPDWFLQHYRSNHYRWDNNFQKTYRFYVGGEVAFPTRYVQPKVKVGFENLTRYIYFAQGGLPVQHAGNIQVLSVDAQLNIRTKRFGMDNHVVWQLSGSEAIPLPAIVLYHNIYYYDSWFRRAMDVQFGVDMRYHTAYYAPVINPATGQFCIQQTEQVGNFPVFNVYANFYVRLLRLRFFAHFTHWNEYFMAKNYYSMSGYPVNPPQFRAGVAWHFYK